MIKPTARFFVIPFAAIVTLASLSAHSAAPRVAPSDAASSVREQVIDCSAKSPTEVCVLSAASDR